MSYLTYPNLLEARERIVELERQLAAEKAAREKAENALVPSADLANTWAREVGVSEARDEFGLQDLIDRLQATTSARLSKVERERDAAHDAALVKPLVEALIQMRSLVRQLDYVDYELREAVTRLVDRALAAHKPCPTCEGTRTIQDHPIISCTDDAEEIEAKQQMGRRPCLTCDGTREIRERQPYPNESTIIVRPCSDCAGGKKE